MKTTTRKPYLTISQQTILRCLLFSKEGLTSRQLASRLDGTVASIRQKLLILRARRLVIGKPFETKHTQQLSFYITSKGIEELMLYGETI